MKKMYRLQFDFIQKHGHCSKPLFVKRLVSCPTLTLSQISLRPPYPYIFSSTQKTLSLLLIF